MKDILEYLITEGEILTSTIIFIPVEKNRYRSYDAYKTNESERYKIWLSSVQRFIKLNYNEDLDEINELAKNMYDRTIKGNHQKILGVLKAIKLMPQKMIEKVDNYIPIISIDNRNIQSQSQSQTQVIDIILETIKSGLTDRQREEIKEIIEKYKNEPQNAKSVVFERIKSFGYDIASNVLANVITNPNVWNKF